jgi:hypothetical protein
VNSVIKVIQIRPVAFVAILAFAIYLPGFSWGAPHATAADRTKSWGPDDETPLGPLAEIHNILEPKPNRNLGYPLMFSFTVAAAYSPYLGFLKLTDQWHEISGVYPFGFSDPVAVLKNLTLIAHFLTVLMGVGIAVCAFDIGKTLWNQDTGILAAAFVMLCYPMLYYARNGNVDVPMLFFCAIAIAAFVRSLTTNLRMGSAITMGVAAGLALATKESALGLLAPVPVFLTIIHFATRTKLDSHANKKFWKNAGIGISVSLISFGIGSGLFVEPERYFSHLNFLSMRLEQIQEGDLVIRGVFPYTWNGHIEFAKAIASSLIQIMTLPGLFLALLGIGWTIRSEPRAYVVALLALAYLAYMFLTIRVDQIRYLLPVPFVLAPFAARATLLTLKKRPKLIGGLGLIAAFWALGASAVNGIALTHGMIKDSRYTASEWIKNQVKPGDIIEYFGPSGKLPSIPLGIVTRGATDYFGIFVPVPRDPAKAEEIATSWKERKPTFIITLPDISSIGEEPHSMSCPPLLYQRLLDGSIGYYLVAEFQTRPVTPWLKQPGLDYPVVNPPIRIFKRQNN